MLTLKARVRWWDDKKGYGFLEGNPDIFLHYSALRGEGFKSPKEGDLIEFELIDGPKGPVAGNAWRVNRMMEIDS